MINQCLELNMKMKENTALNKSHALLKEIERAHNNFNNRTVHLNPNNTVLPAYLVGAGTEAKMTR